MFQPGDDVKVDFRGRDHLGEVMAHSGAYVMVRIIIDPLWDYGENSAQLDPTPIVCVKPSDVRLADASEPL